MLLKFKLQPRSLRAKGIYFYCTYSISVPRDIIDTIFGNSCIRNQRAPRDGIKTALKLFYFVHCGLCKAHKNSRVFEEIVRHHVQEMKVKYNHSDQSLSVGVSSFNFYDWPPSLPVG